MQEYKDVNDFFENLPKDQVTIIYGQPASGKTTLALQASLYYIRQKKKVFFIDSENSFNMNRLRQMDPEVDSYLDYLIVLRPRSLLEQEEMITDLPLRTSLVVVDSMSKYYRIEVKDDPEKANMSVITQLRKLHKYVDQDIPVIVTNQVYSTMDKSVKIVGGEMIMRWSKFLVRLDKTPRRIVIEKPALKMLNFKIKDQGLVD